MLRDVCAIFETHYSTVRRALSAGAEPTDIMLDDNEQQVGWTIDKFIT